ncbi:MAG: FAD-dependent oxidoreductase, partial [Rhodospirillales bacterium]
MNTHSKSIAVIGAGIVGLSVSYYIAKSGYQVTLYDGNEPGSGTSRGHMNVIASYGLPAINQPD